jgi:hypothetical protein
MFDDPEVIRTINSETHPVWFVFNETGFPSHLPVFEGCRTGFDLPWVRTNCAQWILTDPCGEKMYYWSAENYYRQMVATGRASFSPDAFYLALIRYRQWGEDLGKRERQKLEDLLAHHRAEATIPFREPRFYTACVISDILGGTGLDWLSYMTMLRPPGPGEPDLVVPGVRNAAIHAIGDLLTNLTPLDPLAVEAVHVVGSRKARNGEIAEEDTRIEKENPFPIFILQRAAEGLMMLTGGNREDSDLIKAASRWWLENASNPNYRVEYPSDLRLRHYTRNPTLLESA